MPSHIHYPSFPITSVFASCFFNFLQSLSEFLLLHLRQFHLLRRSVSCYQTNCVLFLCFFDRLCCIHSFLIAFGRQHSVYLRSPFLRFDARSNSSTRPPCWRWIWIYDRLSVRCVTYWECCRGRWHWELSQYRAETSPSGPFANICDRFETSS